MNSFTIPKAEVERWKKLSKEDLETYWDRYLMIIPGLESLLWDFLKRRNDNLTSADADAQINTYQAIKRIKDFYDIRLELIEKLVFKKPVDGSSLSKL
ncbi:MAG: hypothetical protein HQ541_20715 [Mariniphaga sp.]|nr:hypothetical protein [Mariniphaga sp.]